MSRKVLNVMLIVVLLGVLLAACDRPASTQPGPTPTGVGEIPFPVQQPTTSLGALATQTALAKTPGGVATTTPLPGAKPTTPAQPQPTQAPAQPNATAVVPPAVQPTAKPEIVVPTATPGRPATYTIQQGDHYICIARRYNLALDEFLALNGLNMNSLAVSGLTVKIPQGGSWSSTFGNRSLKPHPDTYTVVAGDTVNKIACGYGDADPNAIIAANDLKAPYTLQSGDSLKIP